MSTSAIAARALGPDISTRWWGDGSPENSVVELDVGGHRVQLSRDAAQSLGKQLLNNVRAIDRLHKENEKEDS